MRAKLAELRAAVAAYTRETGHVPQFVLGPAMHQTSIPTIRLAHCRMLSNREELIDEMPDHGHVVEVGTQTGQFAHFILSRRPNVRLFTIDMDYSQFARESLQPFIQTARLTTIEGISWEELARFPEGFFSWIYVDASHALENVRRDLAVARTRVAVGGYVVCNDYTIWSPFEATPYGVMPAVNELVAQHDFDVTHFALHPFGYHDIALRRGS
ncbi:MAG TPA: class I SAM-dependent methyltransferase [Acetobacteraceae bacterium]|nr:class I SAM-dependent methyltransferase [Acetobacteraceae bacterium]